MKPNEPVFLIEDFSGRCDLESDMRRNAPGRLPRTIVDPEGVISVDNGALRIAPLLDQAWGRAAIAYGPIPRQGGLVLSVYLLNGHNTAQVENLPESLWRRFDRWWRGCDQESRIERLRRWVRSGRMRRTFHLFRWWLHLRKGRKSICRLDENLAVGWFTDPAPGDPTGSGSAMVMHACGGDNGELWVRSSSRNTPVLRQVPDIPLCLTVVLRERGAAYYVGATPGTHQLPAYPLVRPIAIDTCSDDSDVHAVVTQSAFGQIGFRIDSRVYSVRVAKVDELANWYGTACAADCMSGTGRLDSLPAERGGEWHVFEGELIRTEAGACATTGSAAAVLRPGGEIGLVHAVMTPGVGLNGCGLTARFSDSRNMLHVVLNRESLELVEIRNSVVTSRGRVDGLALARETDVALQVLLDDMRVTCFLDGKPMIAAAVSIAPTATDGVGVRLGGLARVRNVEAHPSRIRLPAALCSKPVDLPRVGNVRVTELFDGETRPLEGKSVSSGGAVWTRLIGAGKIEVTGQSCARVIASPDKPNPGRTAYAIPWAEAELAELEMEITVPGTEPGQRHKPRGGFIFWQDEANFLIVSLWRGDEYPGASISSFFQIDGFEDIYDAVWTNIGPRAWYGDSLRLRVLFDGTQYLASIDGEPVLFRRLTDVYPTCKSMSINRVGIVANWEWGNDTGSLFREFTARGVAQRAVRNTGSVVYS